MDFFDPNIRSAFNTFSHYLVGKGIPPSLGQTTALEGLYGQVLRESMMLAFNDTFRVMFFFTLAVVPFTLLFRKQQKKNSPATAH